LCVCVRSHASFVAGRRRGRILPCTGVGSVSAGRPVYRYNATHSERAAKGLHVVVQTTLQCDGVAVPPTRQRSAAERVAFSLCTRDNGPPCPPWHPPGYYAGTIRSRVANTCPPPRRYCLKHFWTRRAENFKCRTMHDAHNVIDACYCIMLYIVCAHVWTIYIYLERESERARIISVRIRDA